jgi:hypothetical protein
MGRIQRSGERHAQALPKHKVRTLNEMEELREENRQLRELVAHLSKLVLVQIAEPTKSEAQAADTDA